jgi:hypothetical protein
MGRGDYHGHAATAAGAVHRPRRASPDAPAAVSKGRREEGERRPREEREAPCREPSERERQERLRAVRTAAGPYPSDPLTPSVIT